MISTSAYEIDASVASYLQSHTKSILHFNSSKFMGNKNLLKETGDIIIFDRKNEVFIPFNSPLLLCKVMSLMSI